MLLRHPAIRWIGTILQLLGACKRLKVPSTNTTLSTTYTFYLTHSKLVNLQGIVLQHGYNVTAQKV